MRSIKTLIAGLAVALLCVTGTFADDAINLNEVGAMLVYPVVVANDDLGWDEGGGGPDVETFITMTNAGAEEVWAHVSYINGDKRHDECYECDFTIPLSGNDTETLVITDGNYGGIQTKPLDTHLQPA